jgi:hypothetical protein
MTVPKDETKRGPNALKILGRNGKTTVGAGRATEPALPGRLSSAGKPIPPNAQTLQSRDRRGWPSDRHPRANRGLVHLLARASEHDHAAVHDCVVVANIARPFEILLDDEDRHLALAA